MSTLLLERSSAHDESFECDTRMRLDGALLLAGTADAHGRLTLDELITGVWEGLAVRGTVDCPVCASPMALSSYRDSDDQQMGSCRGCGSKLC
jgi:hypothetical protein